MREFDSMAEAVLAPDSGAVPPDGAGGPIAEPMARINAAVKQGRIEEAAALAERTVADASGSLGDDHPDVLRLRELTAYIAYWPRRPAFLPSLAGAGPAPPPTWRLTGRVRERAERGRRLACRPRPDPGLHLGVT